MKLAEALVLRADANTRIERLQGRIKSYVVVQEGDAPQEDPNLLLDRLAQLLDQLRDLITRINRTNLQTLLPNGQSLTAALAQRDVLARHHELLTIVADAVSAQFTRYSRRELRFVATVDVVALRRQIDDLARQRRELDLAIQAVNWEAELIE